jgi:hypothetical protein
VGFSSSLRFGVLVAALSLPCGIVLKADAIPVFGTGMSAANTPLPAGADPHYTVTYGDTNGPAVVDNFHGDGASDNPNAEGPWVPNQPNAVLGIDRRCTKRITGKCADILYD